MVLETKIKVSQSKKAWTQYITIPAMVVADSQYPFKPNDELHLKIEPRLGIMVISREDRPFKVTPNGVLIMQDHMEHIEKFEVEMDAISKKAE